MNAINDDDVLAAAKEDQESVVELTRELIRLPSRGGIDSYEPVLERLRAWLAQRPPSRHGAQGQHRSHRRPDL